MSLEQKPIPNETVTDVTPGTDTGSIHVYVDKDKERSVVRKLDWHLLPVCMTAFVLNFLDRSNIGNAKVAGMVTDLHMPGYEFNGRPSPYHQKYCGRAMADWPVSQWPSLSFMSPISFSRSP
jgi:hypothetical protein